MKYHECSCKKSIYSPYESIIVWFEQYLINWFKITNSYHISSVFVSSCRAIFQKIKIEHYINNYRYELVNMSVKEINSP